MIEIIMFYLALLCTVPTPHQPGKKCNGIHIMTAKDDGETGDIKPPFPPPPPPPPHP